MSIRMKGNLMEPKETEEQLTKKGGDIQQLS